MQFSSILNNQVTSEWPKFWKMRLKKVRHQLHQSKAFNQLGDRKKSQAILLKLILFWSNKILTKATKSSSSKFLNLLFPPKWRKRILLTRSLNSSFKYILWSTLSTHILVTKTSRSRRNIRCFLRRRVSSKSTLTQEVPNSQKQMNSWLTMLYHTFQIHQTIHLSNTCSLSSGFKTWNKS